ncbi:unnamed protein product [Tuber melanosporum]|uniref:(Perigord truffle) hypothetical protein n=1 Tax=Tuber melanosporum (strain Mel28) TaxID=656061 RepID=D5GDZ3_TUBMM|nr:uncharacterized protein GSTUM_00001111001 [Tuber melanosporum]CAZ82736.1 unnamed protein product [Tuber melanosporum]
MVYYIYLQCAVFYIALCLSLSNLYRLKSF